jgi:hypothetical protein
VLRAPKDDVEENGNEVQALLSQSIEVLPSVGGTRCLGENSLLLEKGETGSKDICRESFFRIQKLAVGLLASENDIANDQERPLVTEDL